MQFSENNMERFREVFDIPGFIEPWLDRFFTYEEIALVLLLADEPLRIG